MKHHVVQHDSTAGLVDFRQVEGCKKQRTKDKNKNEKKEIRLNHAELALIILYPQ